MGQSQKLGRVDLWPYQQQWSPWGNLHSQEEVMKWGGGGASLTNSKFFYHSLHSYISESIMGRGSSPPSPRPCPLLTPLVYTYVVKTGHLHCPQTLVYHHSVSCCKVLIPPSLSYSCGRCSGLWNSCQPSTLMHYPFTPSILLSLLYIPPRLSNPGPPQPAFHTT